MHRARDWGEVIGMTNDANPPLDLESLWGRPGFLIRRAHQVAQMLFLEETAALGITATQYGILRILSACPGLDQIGVAKLLGQDRSTTSFVLEKLVTDGLVERRQNRVDRRRRELSLTARGDDVLDALSLPVRRAQDRLLSPLSPTDAEHLLAMLSTVVESFNDVARAPLDPSATNRTSSAASSDGTDR